MRWRSLPLDGALGAWAAPWDALNARRFGAHPMLSAAFIDGLLRLWPAPGLRLCVLEGESGIEALCLVRPQRPGVWSSYMPSQAQVSPSLLRGPLDLQALIACLPWTALQLDLTGIDPLVQGDTLYGATLQRQPAALTMAVALDESEERYWASRSKKLRENLRRHERAAASEGLTTRYAEHSEPADVEAAVARYAHLESLGWKGRSGTALAPGNTQHRFYEELLTKAAERGDSRVFELWLGDRLVASRLVLAGTQRVVALKTSYDEAFKAQAPGRLLLRHTLQRARAIWPGRQFEFYTNASRDQLAWATSQRWMLHLTLHRSHLFELIAATRRRLRPTHSESGERVQVLSLADEWPADVQELFDSAERRRIAYGSRWLKNLGATVFPADSGARVYVLRRDDRPVAALPVLLRLGRGASVEALGNYYSTLYAPVLADDAGNALATLVRAAAADCPGLSQMRFGPMDPADPVYRDLRDALRTAGLLPFDYFCHGNWYQGMRGNGADYLAQREGALRSTIKRAEKKLAAAGAQIEILSNPAEVERAIDGFVRVYNRSWKKPEPYPDFMPGLMRMSAEAGWLRAGLVWLGDTPIAAQMWMVANGRAEIYKLAYDEAHKQLAPGTVLTARLMQHVIDVDQVREIDYLIGDDSYKAQWTAERRERWGLVAYNPRSLRGLLGWLRKRVALRLRGKAAPPPVDSRPPQS